MQALDAACGDVKRAGGLLLGDGMVLGRPETPEEDVSLAIDSVSDGVVLMDSSGIAVPTDSSGKARVDSSGDDRDPDVELEELFDELNVDDADAEVDEATLLGEINWVS